MLLTCADAQVRGHVQCQSVSEHGLAATLEKVTERLAADVPNMLRSGGELIAYYLSDDRRPAERPWPRRHADTQRDLCTRYLEPVIGHLASQDIRVANMQAAVNAAPTAKEGKRVRAMISALVSAGISGGYLTSDRLKGVHWQVQGRPMAAPLSVPCCIPRVIRAGPAFGPATMTLGPSHPAGRWGIVG
jgi:hypothetical protein